MTTNNISKELNKLLAKSSSYYIDLIRNKNNEFDFKKPVILFGAAKLSIVFINFLKNKGVKIVALSDNSAQVIGKKINGIEIIKKSKLKEIFGTDIQIITASLYYRDMIKDLKKLGFKNVFEPMYFSTLYSNDFDVLIWKNDIKLILKSKKLINNAFDILHDLKSQQIYFNIIKYRLLLDDKSLKGLSKLKDFNSEYFDKKIIHLTDSEVFLDGGAYDGDTIKLIIEESKNKYKNIFAFEPDNNNYKKMDKYVKNLNDPRIKLLKFGLGEKNEMLNFTNEGNLQSKVVKYGETRIKIIPIDKFIDKKITYIKLDIEGFEKKALKGAVKTIKKNKPKLTICSYHNSYDIWELPLLINKLHPDYKIFLRHYSDYLMDTICYAV